MSIDADRKIFVRSTQDGERGYRVTRDGREMVRLDRPNEDILRPWNGGAQWVPEVETRPISQAQLGQVAFECDKALCRVLGEHGAAMKSWADLTDAQRIAWMEKGPNPAKHHIKRVELYHAVCLVLEPLTR